MFLNENRLEYKLLGGFPGGLVVKNLPANAGDMGDEGSIPGWGRASGGGNDNPLQYLKREGKGNESSYLLEECIVKLLAKKGANLEIFVFEVNVFKKNVLSLHANSAKGLTITFVEQLAAKVKGHFC